MDSSTKEFSQWRAFFWPVHGYELKKVLPMLLMFFFIIFNYTILRDTKDTLLITAPGSGAEVIPFVKVWLVVPGAVIFMLIYAKLSNILSKQTLFYCTIIPFLIFFALFATVLYPARDYLHPTVSADQLEVFLPKGFGGLVAIYRNWTYSIFYVLAELWGSVMLSLTFWGFANQITRVNEAKRFYTLFGLGGNTAPLFSGIIIVHVSDIRTKLPAGVDAWGVTLNLLMAAVVVAGILVMGCYYWMNRSVLTDPKFFDSQEVKKSAPKLKMSIKESFLFLSKSKYIACLAIIVLAYGICINLVEVTWKSQVKIQYPDANDYSTFMGYFSSFTGCTSFFMVLFVGGNVIRRMGWGVAALITPIVLLLTGTAFFSFVLFRDNFSPSIQLFGCTPLMLAVLFGAAQNIMSKSTKYSLFDPTKEMAYIPLDEESKVKGKAAIDVVAARLGKSGGSFIQQGLIILLGSIGAMTPYIAVILLITIFAWIFAARSLNKQFLALTSSSEPEPKSAPLSAQTAAEHALAKS